VSWRRVLLVVAALLVVNVPWALHEVELHRAETGGVRVSATVETVSDAGGGQSLVTFRLPTSIDSSQDVRTVKVDSATGDAAAASQTLPVRVLRGHPSVFYVAGQVRSWASTIVIGVADALILLVVLLSWRLGGRIRRPALVAVALGDVESGDAGSLLDKQKDGTYLINGEIKEIDVGMLVLTLRDRDVTVHLRGHHNPLTPGERAQVLAHLVG
jgi:hypothetical protein